MVECDVENVGISKKVGNVETIRTDFTDMNAKTNWTYFFETVRNSETVGSATGPGRGGYRTDFSESEDEDANYVAFESEYFDSPFEDSDNDIVDDDEVCDVPVGRDWEGYSWIYRRFK
ncbi:hypothetical protein GQ457_04G014390 [Hibiscus cannabinus]